MASYDQELDPLSLAFNSLWDLAEQSSRLTGMVKPGNRIHYNLQSDLPPEKDEISVGDLPELVLLVTQMSGGLRVTSDGSRIVASFEWWLSTGIHGITNAVLPLAWTVFCAMTPWPKEGGVARTLKWRDKTFIKRVDLRDAQFGLQRQELNRGVGGWSCVWGAEVEMWFATADVIAANDFIVKDRSF